jgi:hypothetical protein|nr:MAG TPA: hypothetical protein [Caudoviricetes sp.]
MLRTIRIEEGLGRLTKDARELKNAYMGEYICKVINDMYQSICNGEKEENKGE